MTVLVLPLVFEFEPPGPLLNLNDRRNRWDHARLVKTWRQSVYFEACAAIKGGPAARRLPGPWPVTVTLRLPVKSKRFDGSNWMPSVKAAIDGMTDAGLWPDDSSEWVRVAEPVMELGRTLVRVEITSPTVSSET